MQSWNFLPKHSLFPTNADDGELADMLSTAVTTQMDDDSVFIHQRIGENSEISITKAPKCYWNLIRRFLWRRAVFIGVINSGMEGMGEEVKDAIKRNAIYTQRVYNAVRKPLEDVIEIHGGRVRLFDIYMQEEYFVFRHEPAAVIVWQGNNEENLRCSDTGALDWKKNQSLVGPEWEGSRFRWDCARIDAGSMVKLSEDCKRIFGDFYDHPFAQMVVIETDGIPERFYAGGTCIKLHSGWKRLKNS